MTYGIVIGILILALLATLIAVVVEKPAKIPHLEDGQLPDEQDDPLPVVAYTPAAIAVQPVIEPAPPPAAPAGIELAPPFEPAEDSASSPETADVDDPDLWRFDPETGEPIDRSRVAAQTVTGEEPVPEGASNVDWDVSPETVPDDVPPVIRSTEQWTDPPAEAPTVATGFDQAVEEPALDESGSSESPEGSDSDPGPFRI